MKLLRIFLVLTVVSGIFSNHSSYGSGYDHYKTSRIGVCEAQSRCIRVELNECNGTTRPVIFYWSDEDESCVNESKSFISYACPAAATPGGSEYNVPELNWMPGVENGFVVEAAVGHHTCFGIKDERSEEWRPQCPFSNLISITVQYEIPSNLTNITVLGHCKTSGMFCSGGCMREQKWCLLVPECDTLTQSQTADECTTNTSMMQCSCREDRDCPYTNSTCGPSGHCVCKPGFSSTVNLPFGCRAVTACSSECMNIEQAVCVNNQCTCPSTFHLSADGSYCQCDSGLTIVGSQCVPATIGSECGRRSALACDGIANARCHSTRKKCRCLDGYEVRVKTGRKVCRRESNRGYQKSY